MGTTQPIRNTEKLSHFVAYYATAEPNTRNYLLIMTGLHTALRISDILALRWRDVIDPLSGKNQTHLSLIEHKTGKSTRIALCSELQNAFYTYYKEDSHQPEAYIFCAAHTPYTPLSRSQAYRIVKKAAENAIHEEHISCHSLRKTFGYHAWKQGIPPAMLMDIYNHSSYAITKRYLGITQDERDDVFLSIHF